MKRLILILIPLCAVILMLAAVKPVSAGKPKVIGIVSIDGLGSFPALSYSWDIRQAGTFHSGGGGASGKVEIADLTVTKPLDGLTPELFMACATGDHITTVRLDLYGPGSNVALSFILTTVLVVSVSQANPGIVDGTTEQILFNFAKVQVVRGRSSAGWDVSKNTKA